MTKLGVSLAILGLVACKGHGKAAAPGGDAGAPASASGTGSASAAPAGGSALGLLGGGMDPLQLLQNAVENLQKPGPYEAPAQSDGYRVDAPHWAVLHLSGEVAELETIGLTGGSGAVPLRTLMDRLRALGGDANVAGLLLRVDGLSISLPDAIELRGAIADVRAAGKTVACHTEEISNAPYLVLTACGRIAVAPLGEVVVSGPAAMPVHLKGLLDKLGVDADFLHVGAYKGAAEPLTRDAPSPEMTETIGAILDGAYATMVAVIAQGRGLQRDQVATLIDRAMFSAEEAKAAGLVDDIATFEAFRDQVVGQVAWARLRVEKKDDPMAAMFKLARFFGVMPASRPSGPHLALVHAVGDVVDGAGDGALGAREQIASGTLVPALRTLAADDDVKAVVLRIDSGGGSARAAELIWHAVSELAAKKPVVVSMSDVAASGGYYIAAPATKIYALDDTLTGSIGVVGGKLAPARGLADLGVTTYPMGRGKRATMMRSLGPWTPDERAAVQASMNEVYGVFVGRVAAGRKLARADVEKLAAGRVWTGAQAKKLGLVDELGGLDAAIADAETLGGLDRDAVIEVYPAAPTLRDYVTRFGGAQLPFGMTAALAEVTRDLSPELAATVEHLLRQVASFQTATIQTVAILPMTVR